MEEEERHWAHKLIIGILGLSLLVLIGSTFFLPLQGNLITRMIGTPLDGKIQVVFSDNLKTEQSQHFLEGFLTRYPNTGKIFLFLDNARAHHSKDLDSFFEVHKDKLELVF